MDTLMMLKKTNCKIYTIITSDNKYYLGAFSDYGNYCNIHFYQLDSNSIEVGTPYGSDDITCVQVYLKRMQTLAPVDARVYAKNIEIQDLVEKSKILSNLKIAEFKTETIKYLKPLTTVSVKQAVKEQEIKSKLAPMLVNINQLSFKQCEKLMQAMRN